MRVNSLDGWTWPTTQATSGRTRKGAAIWVLSQRSVSGDVQITFGRQFQPNGDERGTVCRPNLNQWVVIASWSFRCSYLGRRTVGVGHVFGVGVAKPFREASTPATELVAEPPLGRGTAPVAGVFQTFGTKSVGHHCVVLEPTKKKETASKKWLFPTRIRWCPE